MTGKLTVTHAYALDAADFMSVLTGDEFYTQWHAEEYGLWSPRLSDAARQAVAAAVAVNGSAMLGPFLSALISAVPEFEAMALTDLLTLPVGAFQAWADTFGEDLVKAKECLDALLPAVQELEAKGFRAYWEKERLPLIRRTANETTQFLKELPLDIGKAVSAMLGSGPTKAEEIQLLLCSFAAPHGMKILGRRFVADIRYDHTVMVRIAIHEMFHPPYEWTQVQDAAAALIGDPLFQDSFQTKNPKYGYATMEGFLEECVVEAMELHVSRKAGLIANPVEYLLKHDEGSHRLSAVLLKYFDQIPKRDEEPFSRYVQRLVPQMPVGRLWDEYNAIVTL